MPGRAGRCRSRRRRIAARDRVERRGGRSERARPSPGAAAPRTTWRRVAARGGPGRAAAPRRETLDEHGGAPRRVPRRLSGCRLCRPLPALVACAAEAARTRAPGRSGLAEAVARNLVQADGLQGRVRGGAAATPTPLSTAGSTRQFEGERRDRVPSGAAAAGAPRSRDRAACASARTARGCCRPSACSRAAGGCAAPRSIRSAVPPNAAPNAR